MTQITQAQMVHAWAVLLAAVLFVMMGVAFVQEKRSKLAAVLSLLPGAFCFFLWATAAVRYVLGVSNA